MARSDKPRSPVPPESRATRREVYGALIAFVAGFLGTLATLGWVIVHFVTPEARWWNVVHTSINSIGVSFIAGLGVSCALVRLLSRWHFKRGMYRCPYCDRPRKGNNILCECPDAQALKTN